MTKTPHITADTRMAEAISTSARLRDELAKVTSQIEALQASQRDHDAMPRDAVSDAVALIDGTRQDPAHSQELRRLLDRQNAMQAGAAVADERVHRTRSELSREHMASKTAAVADALEQMAVALQSVLDAGEAFERIKAEAAALGFDAGAGGLPIDVAEGHQEFVEHRMKIIEGMAGELRDRLPDADDAPQRITALADLEGHAKAGETTTMPGKLARLFIRLGRAEILTPGAAAAARLRKAVTE